MNSRNYAGAIWTNHALQRLNQRGLSQPMAGQTFMYPEHTERGKQPGTTEFTRRYDNSKVTVIAKQNDRNEWIILSCWIDPPLPGSVDIKKKAWEQKYKKAGFWKRLWMDILSG